MRWPACDCSLHDSLLYVIVATRPAFEASHVRLLAALGSAPGETGVAVTVVGGIAGVDQKFVRLDITHLVRNVNHHFESNIDGHDRKYVQRLRFAWLGIGAHSGDGVLPGLSVHRYQLQVNVNDTATELHRLHSHARLAVAPDRFHMAKGNHPNHGRVVSVHLIRQFDKSDIPYVTVHGVTLITMLRLGLLSPLVTRAYHQFVALALYEDMAPWNIVFLGVRCVSPNSCAIGRVANSLVTSPAPFPLPALPHAADVGLHRLRHQGPHL